MVEKKTRIQRLKSLIQLKLRFAGSSSLATIIDYSIYQILIYKNFAPASANVASSGTGMIINFILQKKYVFRLNRKVSIAFAISLVSSLFGLALSTTIIHNLSKILFFSENQFITKAIVTGCIFFYNFYMKRFAFEKRLL